MVHERLKALRESLEERETSAKAKARAKARERAEKSKRKERASKAKSRAKARERAKKQERIEEGNPENLREEIAVAAREARQGVAAAKGTVSAEREFLAQELGISTEHAGEVAQTGVSIAEQVREATGSLGQLDLDGDGDTDILQALDEPGGGASRGGGRGSKPRSGADPVFDPTEPVIDLPGKLEEPLFNEDVFAEPSLAEPLPGEEDMGL